MEILRLKVKNSHRSPEESKNHQKKVFFLNIFEKLDILYIYKLFFSLYYIKISW
jgi:hypothetical protein